MATSYGVPGYGGAGSLTVNGQIVPVPMANAFYPSMASSPYYTGSGQPPPTIPLAYTSSSNPSAAQANAAAANPFSFTQSPLIMALIALIVGVLGLRYVHWRG